GVIGSSLCRLRLVFFFQAEDGIRDFHVTGVQTCALPILKLRATLWERVAAMTLGLLIAVGLTVAMAHSRLTEAGVVTGEPASHRSEERRVGKECRDRGPPNQSEKKPMQ